MRSSRRGLAKELEQYIKDYPSIPQFKNYLYIHYAYNNQMKKASKILLQTIREHPDYLFAKTNLADEYINKGNLEKAEELLGSPRDISTLISNRDIFHVSEFLGYQATAIKLELRKNELENAEKRLKMLVSIAPESYITEAMATEMLVKRFQDVEDLIEEEDIEMLSVDSFPTKIYEPTTSAPELTHPELKNLYKFPADDLPERIIKSILDLPRESVIADLEKIIEDGIRRFDFYYDAYSDWKEEEQSFLVHATYLLAGLEAYSSLPKILDLFRQGEDFLEYWFADRITEYFEIPVYLLGKDQLDLLKAYALEPNQFYFPRLFTTSAACQVALHFPDRRQEVIDWFEDLYAHLLKNADDKNLIDSDFIGWSVGEVINFRGKELIPTVKTIHGKGWISDILMGPLGQILRECQSAPDPSNINPFPKNIRDFYLKNYLKDRPLPKLPLGTEDEPESDYEEYLMNILQRSMGDDEIFDDEDYEYDFDDEEDYEEDYKAIETVRRETPKVGRNAPCPCGSGKV